MQVLATLFTDWPLDIRRFQGLIRDLAQHPQAGDIQPQDDGATHSWEGEGIEIHVGLDSSPTLLPPQRDALLRLGFRPSVGLHLRSPEIDVEGPILWDLLRLYATELQGWVLTSHAELVAVAARCGIEDGVLHIPSGKGKNAETVLISARSLRMCHP